MAAGAGEGFRERNCRAHVGEAAVRKAWDVLKEGGEVYMELAPSFFAKAHGSLRDKYGINRMFTAMKQRLPGSPPPEGNFFCFHQPAFLSRKRGFGEEMCPKGI